jgi:hypothetical protein
MPTIMRRITERTVVAAMSSMRVNAAAGRRGVKGLREEGVRIPLSRDAPRSCGTRLLVLSRGIWNLKKEKAEKRSCFAGVA